MKKNRVLANSKTLLSLVGAILSLFAATGFSQNAPKPANCQPNVTSASILDGVRVDGVLSIGTLDVECLPIPRKGASGYNYSPYEDAKFLTNLKTSSGTLVNSFVWYGKKYLRWVRFTNYEVVGGKESLKELASGDYLLEFAVDGRVFQTFRFSLVTKRSNDIYRPGTIYLLEGAWRDEAVLTAPTAENVMCFNFRFRIPFELAETKPVSVPFELTMIRDRDQKPVAEKRGAKLTLENTWRSYRTCFDRPAGEKTADNAVLKLREIAAVDGNYTIHLSVDGKPYASYRLVVKNGGINGAALPARNIRLTLPANIPRRR